MAPGLLVTRRSSRSRCKRSLTCYAKLITGLVMRLLNNSDSFIFAKGCLPGSLDLSQDLLSFSPPDVALGFEVMPGEVLHDGIDQLAHAAEAAGQDRLLAQVSEEAFDQIHPG